ncbi:MULTISPECIES: AsmA family protein [Phyllobacteriaceae]|jgi:AsmA protein|uniref:Membrane assembly protein AsmA n=2 Tax=Mesorhizobium TaxID=68287 RepID=A0A1C2DC90_9HYPH|nr:MULTISPECIES: AsmA family protein [Mesorhizobium]MBN9236754.1 AsmA family protein [Mesorhizobium sp.]MDQ0331139.1 AsmA protein [Mesorhizobium sp. YL-MeA3-2017]OCX12364.1 membrane assembly protein AsmA [Mesorhizobium hungaricum]
MPSPLIWRAIWAVAIAVIVAVLAFVAVPYFASNRIVRDRIAWEMSAWSGFRVTIDGTPEIEIWPQFRAILTGVTLSNWSDDKAPPVMQADRVEIDLSAMSALRGDVVFSGVRLVKPVFRVEPAAHGLFLPPMPSGGRVARAIDAARELVKAKPDKPDTGKLASEGFGTVEFQDGKVIAAIDGTDTDMLTNLSGQLDWSALNAAGSLTASGVWRGETVAVEAASPGPMLLFAGAAAPVTLSLKAAPANFSFDGTGNLSGQSFFDGQAKFTAPSLRRALQWLEAGIAPGAARGPVSITSKVSGDTGRIKFDKTEIDLDKTPGMGALDLSFVDPMPMISGTLAFDTVDLAAFLSAFTSPTASSGTDLDVIDMSFADRFNLDLRLSAAHATAGRIQLADVAATAQVKNGLAVFDISDATAFGGNIQTSLRIDRRPEGTQVEMKLLASDVNGADFTAAAGMTRLTPTGTGTVSLILKGPGKSWNSILQNADGSVSATFGPGNLTGLNLPAFLKRNEEGGFFALDDVSNGTLPIDGAELKATISKGVARIDRAEAKSAQTKIWLSGIVPYAGRGLALSGGVNQPKPAATPAPQPAPAQPATGTQPIPGAQPAPTQNGQPVSVTPTPAGQTTTSATPPPPAPTPPVNNGNQATFFVGGTWTTPFVSPIIRRNAGE